MYSRAVLITTAALALMIVVPSTPAHADPATCQSAIAKNLRKFKRIHLKEHVKCLRKQNLGRITGPCPDADAQLKIQSYADKASLGIANSCTSADLAALNFRSDCAYEVVVSTTGEEFDCSQKNVLTGPDIDPTLLAECLECWKAAELSEYIAILYPSHAMEVCDGDLSETSPVCSDIDCTTPLPDQRDLTGGEGDCQHGIGKAGFKYLIKREKLLEKCALSGMTRATCLADADVQLKLMKYENAKSAKIHRKCGNRDPAASPPFCCRTGMANQCTVYATRDDCLNNMGEVQEDKTCNAGNCDSLMGNKNVTWWENCPESATCPGTALATLDNLIACVDTTADTIVDELMCLQFHGNNNADWPCPVD